MAVRYVGARGLGARGVADGGGRCPACSAIRGPRRSHVRGGSSRLPPVTNALPAPRPPTHRRAVPAHASSATFFSFCRPILAPAQALLARPPSRVRTAHPDDPAPIPVLSPAD